MATVMQRGIFIILGILQACRGQPEATTCADPEATTCADPEASPASASMLQAKSVHSKVSTKLSRDASQMSEEEAMVRISMAVYDLTTTVGGWTLEQSLEVGVVGGLHKDRLGIYKQGTTCALAFSGTDDVQDITNDLNPEAGDICGMGRVHLGFFRELVQMTQEPGFQSTLVPYLANQCATVFAVGHSLGGAVASLFSSIVNNGYNCPLIPSTLSPGFTIAKLYTVGAPAVSKDQITDANGACFGGKRIFNEDNGILNPVDPVARVMQKINFLHPMIEPVRMREWRRYRPTKGCCRKWRWVYYYEKFTSNCDGAAAQRDPNGLTSWASSLHLETAYVTRAKNIFR